MKTSEALERFPDKIADRVRELTSNMHEPDGCHPWLGPVHSQSGLPQIQVGGKEGYACIAVRKYIFRQIGLTERKHLSKPSCGNKLCLNMAHYPVQLKLKLEAPHE